MNTDRELKPGKTLQIGRKIFRGNGIKNVEKKEFSVSNTRFVPEALIKEYNLNEKHFISVQTQKSKSDK